jgi:hypothetical protein
MRFLVLLASPDHVDRWDAAHEAERDVAFAAYRAFGRAVRERGTLVLGDALHRPGTARTVGPGEHHPITDGPFPETVEQLGGFYVVDLPDLETAVELAKLLPEDCSVEVRPTLEVDV